MKVRGRLVYWDYEVKPTHIFISDSIAIGATRESSIVDGVAPSLKIFRSFFLF